MSSLWTPAPTEFSQRAAVINIAGPTDTGRTTLALSAAGPIALIHTAEKIRGIIEPFAVKKDIKTVCLRMPFRKGTDIEKMREACKPLVDRFYEAYFDSFSWAKTRVIDTDDQLYTLFQMASFGTPTPESKRGALNWMEMNAEWMSIVKHARQHTDSSTIFISGMSDEWITVKSPTTGKQTKRKTDRLVRDGHACIPAGCDVCIRTKQIMKDGAAQFQSTVTKGWMSSRELNGVFTMTGAASTLPVIMTAVVPGSTMEEWQ